MGNEHGACISANIRTLTEKCTQYEINSIKETVLSGIEAKDNASALTGKDACELYQRATEYSKNKSVLMAKLIAGYEQMVKKMTQKMTELQNTLFECYRKTA